MIDPVIKSRVEQLALARRLHAALTRHVDASRYARGRRAVEKMATDPAAAEIRRRRRVAEMARRELARQRAVNPRFVPGKRPADAGPRARISRPGPAPKKARTSLPPPAPKPTAPKPTPGLVPAEPPKPPAPTAAPQTAPPDVSGGDLARWLWYGVGAVSAWWLFKNKE